MNGSGVSRVVECCNGLMDSISHLLAASIMKIFTSTSDSNELQWTLMVVALEKATGFPSNSCSYLFIIFPLKLKLASW
jgi:hypothetical protein